MIRTLITDSARLGPGSTLQDLADEIDRLRGHGDRCAVCSGQRCITDAAGEPDDCPACEGTGDVLVRIRPGVDTLAWAMQGCPCRDVDVPEDPTFYDGDLPW